MAEAVTINTGWTSEKLPFFKNQIQLMKGVGVYYWPLKV